jgi:hypothetical protein
MLAASGFDSVSARAEDTVECWHRFFRDRGFAQPVGEIAAFTFVGHSFRIPSDYLWRGQPRPELGEQDAVWLLAVAPDLSPPTAEQTRDFWRPSSPTVRITIFGHPRFLHGQALLDEFVKSHGHENRDGERDANGFAVLRKQPPGRSNWDEIHVSPEGPDNLFHCSFDGSVRYPSCSAQRWIGSPLRLEMHFRKPLIPDYLALDGALTDFMRCALGPAGIPGQMWPPADGWR